MLMIKKIKKIFQNEYWGDLIFATTMILLASIIVVGFEYGRRSLVEEQEPTPYIQKVIIPVHNLYGVRYKDGTIEKVAANSYIWNSGDVKFYINDTIVVKNVHSSMVEDIYLIKKH